MGIFGTKKQTPPPHPRQEPRYDCPVTADAIANVFDRCADFNRRTLYLNNDPRRQVEMLFIAGHRRLQEGLFPGAGKRVHVQQLGQCLAPRRRS